MTNELCILFYIYLPLGFIWHFSIWLLPSSFQLCSLYLVLFVFCLINLCLLQSYDKILPYYLLEAFLFYCSLFNLHFIYIWCETEIKFIFSVRISIWSYIIWWKKKAFFFPPCWSVIFIINQVTIYAFVCFWSLCFIPLVYLFMCAKM